MAKTRSSNFYLANELVFQILSWLPVTSLLRFKFVSKSWFSIISSPAFIETHLITTKKKHPSSLIWISKAYSNLYSYNAVTILNVDEPVTINLPRNYITMTRRFHSCNGLLFIHNMPPGTLHYNFYVSFIWNPLTKWSKKVPNPETTLAKDFAGDRLGFGFDFISGDYKILRIEFGFHETVLEAQLYSASGDSWKEIQVPNALRNFRPPLNSEFVHANGVLYLEGIKEILAFDLHSEVFREFAFPNPLHYTLRSPVLDYEGSVAVIFGELDGDESVCSLWTLDDVSWTKKFNLETNQYLKVRRVYLYLGVGQFVAEVYDGEYIIYDYRKKQSKKFPPLFADEASIALVYNESLVSMKGLNKGKVV